ncbi:MAG TPA: alpha/beta hydrolase, partial [Thermodesulfobacteriota bacterium]|nr:alpha/beta hydrolase [Thermodesulfobacteriota bacterium]
FVGHSMGGLVIRKFLEKNIVENIGRCILIATPNQGMKLSDFAEKRVKIFGKIFRPIYESATYRLNIKRPLVETEIGVIAGNKNNLILGVLLSKESDGRVEVKETMYDGMKEFMVLNYGHKEIHYKKETVVLADNFLQNGKFN